METVMAFAPDCGMRLSRSISLKSYSGTERCQRFAMHGPPSGVAGHQPTIDRNDSAGQERCRGQAQAHRHVGDFFGVAVAAERGSPPGVDRLVLVADAG